MQVVQSLPVAGFYTRLSVEETTARVSAVELIDEKTGKAKFTLNTAAPPSPVLPVFNILLFQFDLLQSKRTRLVLNYSIFAGNYTGVEVDPQPADKQTLTLTYNGVKASVFGVAPPPPSYGAVEVVLKFTAARDEAAKGWIDLDVVVRDIPKPDASNPKLCWEIVLDYPQLLFNNAALGGYVLLDPNGVVGSPSALTENKDRQFSRPMPAQFAALYRLSRTAANTHLAQGIALSANDEQGHWKELHCKTTARTTTLALRLYNSIYFGAPLGSTEEVYFNVDYNLSMGSELTNPKGALMSFRLRAFHLESGAGRPLDWYDVADIYRDWLRAKQPEFYKKENKLNQRQSRGPLQTMQPHTVISNYGVDGPAGELKQPPAAPSPLARWLEIHPITDATRDVAGNANDSVLKVLKRIKSRFGTAAPQLEAQIWGFEMGGLYRYLGGFPPATNVINQQPNRFKNALAELTRAENNFVPIATTSPTYVLWDVRRFRGHLVGGAEAIPNPFPAQFTSGANPSLRTCAVTEGADERGRPSNRVFVVSASCAEAQTVAANQKRNEDGVLLEPPLDNHLYPWRWKLTCPTHAVRRLYIDNWLKAGLIEYGFQLVEYMLETYGQYLCYNVTHNHSWVARLVGRGRWYIQMLRDMFEEVHGLRPGQPFALVHEHIFPEALLPCVDELYEHHCSTLTVWRGDTRSLQLRTGATEQRQARAVPFFRYVFSERLSAKMSLADNRPHGHPGYREKQKPTAKEPAYMLLAARDGDDASPVSFETWSQQCYKYFADNYDAAATQYGIAPRNYEKHRKPGQKAEAPYTYSRCVQNVFNMRSEIFRFGAAAVLGERILIHSTLFDTPQGSDQVHIYDEEVINMAVRAAQMQMLYHEYFVGGRMLGQTLITEGNRAVAAWRAHRRSFSDVKALVDSVSNPGKVSLIDFISRGVDKLTIEPVYKAGEYAESEKTFATRIRTDMIQHMIWQKEFSPTDARALYLFANVGNTNLAALKFSYTRGLDGGTGWKKKGRLFSGAPSKSPKGKVVIQQKSVELNDEESVPLPARSLLAIAIFKGGDI